MLLENVFSDSLFMKCGIHGRKKQLEKLFLSENTGLNIKRNEAKRLYQKIQGQYTEIRLHRLWSMRIGEYIPRYLTAVKDTEKNAEKGILDVFVLSDCINHNARLSVIMSRNIQIIDKTNVDIWMYILCRFPRVEFSKYWDEYSDRNKDRLLWSDSTAQYFMLSKEEEKEGQLKKSLMGLHDPFVCASSRDAAYLPTIVPETDWHYHDYRDSDINRLDRSADYLLHKGITMVRMGRCVQNKINFNNCIDYANNYYDELMDIFLIRECKFFVGDNSGICVLPMALNKPVALKNVVPAFDDVWGTCPQNPQNLYIFKKYYSKNKNRFLTIREMMKIEKKIKGKQRGPLYAKLGIEVVENSQEEILDLVMEMNARIDGEWVETLEDIELQKKYQSIFKEWCKQPFIKENAVLYGKVGAMFLRKNSFLLEC